MFPNFHTNSKKETTATEEEKAVQNQIGNILFERRFIPIFGEINQKVAQKVTTQLLAMSFSSKETDTIYLLVNSPGGHVESGDAIFDIIRAIPQTVKILGSGWVGSIATHIYLSVPLAHRFSLPNTRYLIHQPAGGFGGAASDIEIHAKEILKTRERINGIIAQQTNNTIEKINEDTERDFWMSVEESIDYGIVGQKVDTLAEWINLESTKK